MKLRAHFTTCLALLLIAPFCAVAGTQAPSTRTARGKSYVVCNAETSTGVCDNNTAVDVYADVQQYYSVTFTLTETGTGSSCDIYGINILDRGTPGDNTTEIFDSAVTDFTDFAAVKINSTALSAANPNQTLTYFDFSYMWVNCTAVGTTTTVWMSGSQGLQRK